MLVEKGAGNRRDTSWCVMTDNVLYCSFLRLGLVCMEWVPWFQLDLPAACLWLILSISSCSSASSSFFSTSSYKSGHPS